MAKVNRNTGEITDDQINDEIENEKTEAVELYRRLTNSELADIGTTQEELEQFLASIGLTIEEAVFVASDFILTPKEDLCDIPLFVIQWTFKDSTEYPGSRYAIVHGVRMDTNEKIVFADGGLGIRDQLETLTNKRMKVGVDPRAWQAGAAMPRGLVKSEYGPGIGLDGQERPGGTTFYFA